MTRLGKFGSSLVFVLMMAPAHAEQSQPPFQRTAKRLERGRYLANGPMHCFNCHAESQGDGPNGTLPIPGREGAGRVLGNGIKFPNITADEETGIGRWTDAQLLSAIREGVRPDGTRLSTRMPWNNFSALTEEDAASVVVYIRSLEPIRKEIPRQEETPAIAETRAATLAFEAPVKPTRPDALRTPLERGAYLLKLSHCMSCHTPIGDHSAPIATLTFGGGVGPSGPAGNITQDPSGIPHYDEKLFIQTIRSGKVAGVRELNSAMLWRFYAQMTDDDLKAIFAYLKTVPTVQHRVNTTDDPTPCPVCKQKHGLGDLNLLPPAK